MQLVPYIHSFAHVKSAFRLDDLNPLYVYEAKMSFFIRMTQIRAGAERLLEAQLIPILAQCDYLDARPENDQSFMGQSNIFYFKRCTTEALTYFLYQTKILSYLPPSSGITSSLCPVCNLSMECWPPLEQNMRHLRTRYLPVLFDPSGCSNNSFPGTRVLVEPQRYDRHPPKK
jgi:hypothetical protein